MQLFARITTTALQESTKTNPLIVSKIIFSTGLKSQQLFDRMRQQNKVSPDGWMSTLSLKIKDLSCTKRP